MENRNSSLQNVWSSIIGFNSVIIGSLLYQEPSIYNIQESVRENHKLVEFSLHNCWQVSCGRGIVFNGIDYKIISLVFEENQVTISAISIKSVTELEGDGILRVPLRTNNAEEAFKKPISEFDIDVDKILEGIFEKDYQKEIQDLQILKQTNRRG